MTTTPKGQDDNDPLLAGRSAAQASNGAVSRALQVAVLHNIKD